MSPSRFPTDTNQKISFQNKTESTLTNITVTFYDDKYVAFGDPQTIESLAAGEVSKGIEIPDDSCRYVGFTDAGGKHIGKKYYNFYNDNVASDDVGTFQYNAQTNYCFIYKGLSDVQWGAPNATRIYFDATFSDMSYQNDSGTKDGMPGTDGKLYYILTGDGKETSTGEMTRLEDRSESRHLWYVNVPKGYTKVQFSDTETPPTDKINGRATDTLTWGNLKEPCFYADTGDDITYGGKYRGGYWGEKSAIRDVERGKKVDGKDAEIVKLDTTGTFTPQNDVKYIDSTLYDYYSDYELNGKTREENKSEEVYTNRAFVEFEQFNRALSDYYKDYAEKSGKPVLYPLYTGHFQPNQINDKHFSDIAANLGLYGWGYENTETGDLYGRFMAVNNANVDVNVNTNHKTVDSDTTFQGLVSNTRDEKHNPTLYGTNLAEPHFNEAFLTGENSAKAVLGKVYKDVAFPFKQKNVFEGTNNDDKEGKAQYWYYDSNETPLYLKKDKSEEDGYYLDGNMTPGEKERSKNLTTKSEWTNGYGFFPFNQNEGNHVNQYNYGYGAKLQFDFTLTDNGRIVVGYNNGEEQTVPIKFFFSGDDDVWVFIDDQLVLDVGGAHAKAQGLLEFGEDGENNTVTSYVSKIKDSNNKDSNKLYYESLGSNTKNVKFNKTNYQFNWKSKNQMLLPKNTKHTLTMYYMERGMWESNMAVAFNFPDNNELQVQKVVDLKNVTDDDFRNCFKNQKIFNFTIQNQATHYGTTLAAKPNPSDTEKVNLTATGNTIKPATEPTESNKGDYIFELVKNPWPDSKPDSGQDPGQDTGQNTEQVLHWYARYMDTQSAAREKRRGILTLENPINIKDMRFLTFQVYVDTTDGSEGDLSLNNLYLELLDDKDVQKGSLGTTGINGATYGSVEVTTDQWVTVKLDLHKMKEQDKFSGNVTTIRVGDNYNRNIYFRDFTFIPKAVPSKMTGFTTDQKEIPDYGSAESGHLENAENAQYTSSNDTDTQLVDKDGRFVLEAGETVTFSDQFRRGSYISLKEELNENLYDTKWTVCENGKEVESMSGGKSVSLLDPAPPLIEQKGSGPDDGRTEKITSETEQESGNVQNIYNGQKPTTANTIVFRSYKDPDETKSTLTKLKVKYVNTVKTGGLKIQKKAAEGETLTGTYTFKVTFNDVGGAGLEKEDIIRYVEIDMTDEKKYPDHTVTITGIPVGTRYTIEEVTPLDGSRLQSVTVPKGCDSADVIDNTVEGVIKEPNTCPITAIFTNTKRTLINIEFDKLWKDANGKDLTTTNQPNEIYIQLQRRLATSTNDDDWTPVNYGTKAYVTIAPDDNNGWRQSGGLSHSRRRSRGQRGKQLYLPHCGRYGGRRYIYRGSTRRNHYD